MVSNRRFIHPKNTIRTSTCFGVNHETDLLVLAVLAILEEVDVDDDTEDMSIVVTTCCVVDERDDEVVTTSANDASTDNLEAFFDVPVAVNVDEKEENEKEADDDDVDKDGEDLVQAEKELFYIENVCEFRSVGLASSFDCVVTFWLKIDLICYHLISLIGVIFFQILLLALDRV